jgi:hypothetical protein
MPLTKNSLLTNQACVENLQKQDFDTAPEQSNQNLKVVCTRPPNTLN